MQQKRLDYIDFAKGIGIILVLLGHTYFLPLTPKAVIYSFHMPMFFLLSGMVFSAKRSFKDFFLRKVKTLIVPYIFFLSIYLLVFTLNRNIYYPKKTVGEIIKGIAFAERGYINAIWFFAVLFVSELIMYLIVRLSKDKLLYIILISAVVLISGIVFFCTVDKHWAFQLQICFTSVPFMAAGYLVKKTDLIGKTEKYAPYIIAVSLVLSVVLYYLKVKYYKPYTSLTRNTYRNFPLFYALALSLIALTVYLSVKVKRVKLINYLGKNTVVFFALQHVFVSRPLAMYFKYHITTEFSPFVSFLLALAELAATLLLLSLINYVMNKTFLRIFLAKPLKQNT